MATGDLDGDDLADVAVAHFSMDRVSILRQGPGGTLELPRLLELDQDDRPVALAIADVSGDGRSDLLVGNQGSGQVVVYLQGMDGELPSQPSLRLVAGTAPSAVAVGDLSGDWRGDVLVANGSSQGSLSIFYTR